MKTRQINFLESGEELLFRGDYKAAIPFLETAVSWDPENSLCHQYLGEALLGAGFHADALESFGEAHLRDSKAVEPLYFLARLFRENGEWREAEHCSKTAVKLDRNHSGACFELAQTCIESKNLEMAADLLIVALNNDPDAYGLREEILFQLPQLCERVGRIPAAKKYYVEAFRNGLEDTRSLAAYTNIVTRLQRGA